MGMLLARTDSSREKRAGITWFALNMHQPEVMVRPLREMTGRTLFSQVFLDGATVSDDDIVGEVHCGWRVTTTTLRHVTSVGRG
jgi:alkylation response protein AidB-like acyl-CoA dehydrogenase